MRSLRMKPLGLGMLLACLTLGSTARAQDNYVWVGGNGGNYNLDANWQINGGPGFVPAGEFDELGTIDSGSAIVSDVTVPFGQVRIGTSAGANGSLTIQDGGTLSNYSDPQLAPALLVSLGIDVGGAGIGSLLVQPGGTLNTGYVISQGAGSSVTFDGRGANPTTVNIGTTVSGKASGTNMYGGTTLRVIGPNVDITAANLDLEVGSVFAAQLTGSTHSTIRAPNGMFPDGILRVETSGGYTPTIGTTWALVDTTDIQGNFSAIEAPGVTLPLGQKFTFKEVPSPSSVHGVLGQLGIEQQLVVQVDRGSGAVSIRTGTQGVALDGYILRSALGGLVPAQWNSLQNQSLSDWRESPAGGTANFLAELKPTTSTTVTAGSSLQLGTLWSKPLATVFGTQELEDLQFEYLTPTGEKIVGDVVYVGDKRYNNLVLVVDPVDGDAILQNQSNLSVNIDGYTIHSASASLQPGNGDWNSLDDQNVSTWRESNSNTSNLTELLPDGQLLLAGGASYNLGSLFKTVSAGGSQDLAFQYLFAGDAEFTPGVVVYRNVSQLTGDYNADGLVNAADYTVWRDTLGTTVAPGTAADGNGSGTVDAGDLQVWRAKFGSSSGSASLTLSGSAVPEPSAALLTILGLVLTPLACRQAVKK